MTQSPIVLDRLLYDRKATATLLSISIRSLDYLIANGHVDVRRIRSRVLVPAEELRRMATKGVACSVLEAA